MVNRQALLHGLRLVVVALHQLAAALVAIQESLGSLDERLASLETAVGRIDRNTQKGLGKERG